MNLLVLNIPDYLVNLAFCIRESTIAILPLKWMSA